MKQLCFKTTNMKKLLFIPTFFTAIIAGSQLPEGVNKEHMTVYPVNAGFSVKRAALKTGVELEFIEQGNENGIPVIFLHGLSDSWHSFEMAFQHLPSSIHAFALSQRGHGNSDKPENRYGPKDFAADVAAFIELKNLKKAVIVGHSMGGINTMQFAIDHPSLVKAMVIVGSDPVIRQNDGMSEFLNAVNQMEGKEIGQPFMFEFQRSTLAKPIDSAWFNLLVDEGLKCPLPVFKAALNGLMKTDLTAGLKKLSVPVLIFWGDKDTVFYKKGQDNLRKVLKNEKMIIYEGTGHALHWEEPQRFANDLSAFIEQLPK